ncbi:MAG: cytochrome C oxidase subunit IV family protein, partial [Actinobacteria bacterium]|nr:cytochrome C oxidase subunit IV family protein [Actinomycetota bacterium]
MGHVPIGLYQILGHSFARGLLFVLSTVLSRRLLTHLHGYLRWSLILVFMLMKAGLIVAFFMHMRWERLALM